ncbi:MAG: DinB family protein [Defluviitaleaceae bacterium]|nr:DinB family protein [Defluviitaleaceae bacterium]
MKESLQALLAEWKLTRSTTISFLEELSDADLDKPLPRKVLNTIRQQAHELTIFQEDVINSLTTKTLDFGGEYNYKNLPKETLTQKMAQLDAALEQKLTQQEGTETIDFFGEPRNIHQIMALLISHENMHIGQIIAFCYATGIQVPDSISESMALEG